LETVSRGASNCQGAEEAGKERKTVNWWEQPCFQLGLTDPSQPGDDNCACIRLTGPNKRLEEGFANLHRRLETIDR